jgi:hypothetical protein
MSGPDKCQHNMIDVESTRVDFYALCFHCERDVSEEVSRPGMVYTYNEHFRHWRRVFGGYGVKVT